MHVYMYIQRKFVHTAGTMILQICYKLKVLFCLNVYVNVFYFDLGPETMKIGNIIVE